MEISSLNAVIVVFVFTCMSYGHTVQSGESNATITNPPRPRSTRHKRAVPAILAKIGAQVLEKIVQEILSRNIKDEIAKAIEKSIKKFEEGSESKSEELKKKLGEELSKLVSKNEDFMKKASVIDVIPQKGLDFQKDFGVFSPPGVKIETKFPRERAKQEISSETAYEYNKGVGNVLLNGCYGLTLNPKDPCYQAKRKLPKCMKMMESANFIGVGFDGRGDYSSSSRKRSIIQRFCATGNSYHGESVPDTMTVHGVYDTQVKSMTYNGVEQYRTYLEKMAAVSTSRYMFNEAISKASGSISVGFFGLFGAGGGSSSYNRNSGSQGSSDAHASARSNREDRYQKLFISSLEINIIRYEMFLDDITFNDLNLDFLEDFISLPESYFASGAPYAFQRFILRWGTHYIRSAKFGGQLKILKSMKDTGKLSINKFAEQAQNDMKAMFSTFSSSMAQFHSGSIFHESHSKKEKSHAEGKVKTKSEEKKVKGGTESVQQNHYSNEVLLVQGGDQNVATLVSEMYSTGFKYELHAWLTSIPDYPKPFEFQMEPISRICENLNYNAMFPVKTEDFGCMDESKTHLEDTTGRRYYVWEYEGLDSHNKTVTKYEKRYCDFTNQGELEKAMRRRCNSLKRAISVYLEEGPTPSSDIRLPPGIPGCKTNAMAFDDQQKSSPRKPTWAEVSGGGLVRVITDMPVRIPWLPRARETLRLHFRKSDKKWFVRRPWHWYPSYDGFGNGGSDDVIHNRKVSLRGLVATYNEHTALLTVTEEDYKASIKIKMLQHLSSDIVGATIARVEPLFMLEPLQDYVKKGMTGERPCNVVWSNAHRFNPSVEGGKCISFSAKSEGDIFVAFSVIPRDISTWYYVQISPKGVAIYKGMQIVHFEEKRDARSLGDARLFENYFVCLDETSDGTEVSSVTILYGKMELKSETGHAYAVYVDEKKPLPVRFFAFGNGEKEVSIGDAHVLQTSATGAHQCQNTVKFRATCTTTCHPECKGCEEPNSANHCLKCRNFKELGRCVANCSETRKPDDKKECVCKFRENEICVASCDPTRKPSNSSSRDKNTPECICKYVEEGRCVASCSPDKKPVTSKGKESPKCICKYMLNGKCAAKCPYNNRIDEATEKDASPVCCMLEQSGKCVKRCAADRVKVSFSTSNIPRCLCKFYMKGQENKCYKSCPGATEPTARGAGRSECIAFTYGSLDIKGIPQHDDGNTLSIISDSHRITVDGNIVQWDYTASNTDPFYLLVLKPDINSMYTITAMTKATPRSTGLNTIMLNGTSEIAVRTGDVIGIYNPKRASIPYVEVPCGSHAMVLHYVGDVTARKSYQLMRTNKCRHYAVKVVIQ